jgi:hypothetical protein
VAAVVTNHRLHDILDAGGVESEQPVPRFAHDRLAAEVVEFQNQICVFVFTHSVFAPV